MSSVTESPVAGWRHSGAQCPPAVSDEPAFPDHARDAAESEALPPPAVVIDQVEIGVRGRVSFRASRAVRKRIQSRADIQQFRRHGALTNSPRKTLDKRRVRRIGQAGSQMKADMASISTPFFATHPEAAAIVPPVARGRSPDWRLSANHDHESLFLRACAD